MIAIILAFGLVLGLCYCAYKLFKTGAIDKELKRKQAEDAKLLELIEKHEERNKVLDETFANLNATITSANNTLSDINIRIDGAEQELNILENTKKEREGQIQEKNREFDDITIQIQLAGENLKKIDGEKASRNKELKKIQSSLQAASEALTREKQKAEDDTKYKIDLNPEDIQDIEILESIKPRLGTITRRTVAMSIWSTFYNKKVNELCVRVLGNDQVTGIYRLVDTKTGQSYIGQSVDIKERWRQHIKHGLGIDTPATNKLYQAMMKDGVHNFTFELLETCNKSDLNELERWYIESYSADTLGLNATKGNK